MTQSIDQERAEFLSWISANYADIYSTEEAQMMWDHGHLSALAWKEQAARRAQVVPQGWRLIPEDATEEWLTALGEKGVRIGSFESLLTDVLAAAPQPPEAACNPSMQPELATLAAPVQMPEPVAYLHPHGTCASTDEYYGTVVGWTPLYTEHQVRQLLAAYSVK